MENYFLIIWVGVYIIISFLIGLRKNKKTDLESFVASKNSMGFRAILLSLVGTIVGWAMFFGVGQIGYEAGIIGYVIWACYIVWFFLLWYSIPKIRKFFENKNYLSMIDVIDWEYKSPRTTIAFSIVNFLIFFFILAAQFLVLWTFLSFFIKLDLTYSILLVAMLVAWLNIIIYSIVWWIKKDIMTDVFQTIMIIIWTAIIWTIFFNPDTRQSISSLPKMYFTWLGYGPIFLIAAIIFFIPLIFVRFDFRQRILAAKNNKTTKKAFYRAWPIIFIFYFIFTSIWMYAKSSGIIDSKMATLEIISQSFWWITYVIIILAFLAAVMSTADTALNIASVSFSRLRQRKQRSKYLDTKANDKKLLTFVKISSALIWLLSVLVAYLIPDLVDLLVASFTALLILAPTVFALLRGKKPNAKAAFYSITLWFIVFIALTWFIPKESFVAWIIVSIITYFLVKKFSK